MGIKRVRVDDDAPSPVPTPPYGFTPLPDDDENQPTGPIEIGPQEGPQTKFIECQADICIFGGAAGGGKSYALLLEPLRNVYRTPYYSGVIFRRTTPSITHPGSLWDTSRGLYGNCYGAVPFESKPLKWEWENRAGLENPQTGKVWESGAVVQFSHLEHENTVKDWHGAQIPFIGFDELTEFTQYQFWYMVSRNRSVNSQVVPFVRCTCNADADSWVAELIAWWIDQDTGFPIPERDGVVRYFIRVGDELKWGDTREELQPERLGLPKFREDGKEIPYLVKSLTFISAKVWDNKILMQQNPEYLGTLLSLPKVERERLLSGNWKIKPAAGLHFNRAWVDIIDIEQVPDGLSLKRGYDLAATKKTQLNDPDFTCATLIGINEADEDDKNVFVLDHQYAQESSREVEARLKRNAVADGYDVEISVPQDPGQAGKSQTVHIRMEVLDGYPVKTTPETGDKLTRFGPFSARAEMGAELPPGQRPVKVLRAKWNDRWFNQLESFPDAPHDDDVDSTSRAYNAFRQQSTGILQYMKQQAMKLRKEVTERNKPAEKATVEKGGVCFKGPTGCNVLYGLRGEVIFPDERGVFVVTPKHAEVLRRPGSGFEEVK